MEYSRESTFPQNAIVTESDQGSIQMELQVRFQYCIAEISDTIFTDS